MKKEEGMLSPELPRKTTHQIEKGVTSDVSRHRQEPYIREVYMQAPLSKRRLLQNTTEHQRKKNQRKKKRSLLLQP